MRRVITLMLVSETEHSVLLITYTVGSEVDALAQPEVVALAAWSCLPS